MKIREHSLVSCCIIFIRKVLFCSIIYMVIHPMSYCGAQCINTSMYPSDNVIASSFTDTVVISNAQWAGDFCNVEQLSPGKTYKFLSSNPSDYFSIRDAYDHSILLAHGPAPLNFTTVATGQDLVSVHINLQSPVCGTENVNRTTRVVCNNCTPYPATTGINVNQPKAILDIEGEVKVDDIQTLPQAGMIQWNSALKDFQGYDGIKWKSFTENAADWGMGAEEVSHENQSIQKPSTLGSIKLGTSVAISGNYAAVGAIDDKAGTNQPRGAVYFYHFNGSKWVEHFKVWDDFGLPNEEFGTSVSMDGDFVAIGCPKKMIFTNSNQGAVFIYQRMGNSWVEKFTLTAPDGAANDGFGNTVQLNGDRVIVGCKNDDINGNVDQGSAYVFVRNSYFWELQSKLLTPLGSANDLFGTSVAIDGQRAVVGSPLDDDNLVDQGSIHVFQYNGNSWVLDTVIYSDIAEGHFGHSVAINKDWIMSGCPMEDKNGLEDVGSVFWYKYESSSWNKWLKTYHLEPKAEGRYGIAVAMTADNAAVGSYPAQITVFLKQTVTVFRYESGCYLTQKEIINSDFDISGIFGSSVAVSSQFVLCGDPYQDFGLGRIYFYENSE